MEAIAVLYSVAALFGAGVKKLKLPMMVGFMLAGLLLATLGVSWQGQSWLVTISEYGAAFLLFSVGLEINWQYFKDLGWTILGMSLLQMVLIFGLVYSFLYLLGYDFITAIVLSVVVAFSSTVLVAMILKDKKQLHSLHGRILLGVLLIQDMAVIVILLFLPYLNSQNISWWQLVSKIGLNVFTIFLVLGFGRFLFSRLKYLFRHEDEVFFVLSIAYLVTVMYIFSLPFVGLPPEIAGLVAGLSLSNTMERERVANWFEPLRNFLLVFLFFYVGMQVKFEWIIQDIKLLLGLLLAIFVIKMVIGWMVAGVAGLPKKVIMLTGLGLANLSELGFVILPMTNRMGLISDRYLSIYSVLILISIIMSAVFLHNSEKFYSDFGNYFSLLEKAKIFRPKLANNLFWRKIVLIGCHRSGWAIINSLEKEKNELVVLDYDLQVVKRLRLLGVDAYYCDATDVRSLAEFDLGRAKMVISTVPDVRDNLTIWHFIKQNSKKVIPKFICLARTFHEMEILYAAKVHLVLNPYLSVAGDFVSIVESNNKRKILNDYKVSHNKMMRL